MNKNCSSSQLLDEFFARSQQEINDDIQLAVQGKWNSQKTRQSWRHWALVTVQNGTDRSSLAQAYHERLIVGAQHWQRASAEDEKALVLASLPAQELADLACTLACGKGSLKRIAQEMAALVGDPEIVLSPTEMSPAYRELSLKSVRLLQGIFDTVFIQILERYHLEDLAEFYDKSPEEFEVSFEVGRRLINPSSANDYIANESATEHLRDRFGNGSVERLQSRLALRGLV